jgi:putative FmdB family regulatory protein
MPLYEYQCQQCGARSEVLQKLSDGSLTICAACGGPLKRLISSPSVHFKGSGWYATDYARKSGGGSAPNSEGGGEGKADSVGEAKPADKPAAAGGSSAASPSGASTSTSESTSKGSGSGSGGGSGS